MIIATFREGVPAAGRVIERDDDVIRVAGGPPLTLQQLWYYEQAGQLEWAGDELRESVLGSFQPAVPAPGPASPAKSKHLTSLIIAAVVATFLVAVGLVVAMVIPTIIDQRDLPRRSAVRDSMLALEIGLHSWSVDNGDTFPDASLVNEQGLGDYVDRWPTNPYTKEPMHLGSGPGDFSYEVENEGRHFTLTGYGRDGEVVAVVTH